MNTQQNRIFVFSPKLISKDEDYESLAKFLEKIKIEIDKKTFSEFVIFDDGSEKKWINKYSELTGKYRWLKVEYNHINLGVAKTLFKAYKEFLKKAHDEDIIVRLDSDGEHDPLKIAELTGRIKDNFEVAICQITYKKEHQNDFDLVFNPSQGFFQGQVIFGKGITLKHNCPGFTAYKVKVLREIIENYEEYLRKYEIKFLKEFKWGGDLVFLFLANLHGFKINIETLQNSLKNLGVGI